MASQFGTVVVLGLFFEIITKNQGCNWKGDLDSICQQLTDGGHPVGATWVNKEAEVRRSRVSAPLSMSVGKKIGSEFNKLVLILEELAKAASDVDGTLSDRMMKSMNPLQIAAFGRLCAALGKIAPLDAVRRNSPSILEDKDELGMTAVAWACAAGHSSVVQYAVKCGANLNGANQYSWNYCDLAWENKHKELTVELIGLGVKPPNATLIERMKHYGIPIHFRQVPSNTNLPPSKPVH